MSSETTRRGRGPSNKIYDLSDVVGRIRRGDLIALGGMSFHNSPNAFVREILRSNLSDIALVVAPAANFAVDVLVGSGRVSELYCCYVGFEQFGLAPMFRKAAENGSLKVNWMDYASLIGGLTAAAEDLPFYPISGLQGSQIRNVTNRLSEMEDPVSGRSVTVALPIRPDYCVIHCQCLSNKGDAIYNGPVFMDGLLLRASKKSIVIADNSGRSGTRYSKVIPRLNLDIATVSQYSAHPHSSWGDYPVDWRHLGEYISIAKAGKIDDYLDKFLCSDEDLYIRRLDKNWRRKL